MRDRRNKDVEGINTPRTVRRVKRSEGKRGNEKLLRGPFAAVSPAVSPAWRCFFCQLIFRILLNYNETLWGLEEKPTEKMGNGGGEGGGIYVNRRLMSSGIIPWVRLGKRRSRKLMVATHTYVLRLSV